LNSNLKKAAVGALALGVTAGMALSMAPAANAAGEKITFIQGVKGDGFYITMGCGIASAAKKAGAKVTVEGPAPRATLANCSLEKRLLGADAVQVLWNEASERVRIPYLAAIQFPVQGVFEESGWLGMQPKMGGKFHLKVNMGTRPIANKYRE